jgi:beta-glucosidase
LADIPKTSPASDSDARDTSLFGTSPEGFAWAAGIEDTFVAQTERIGERVLDEYALTHHYTYWRDDIDRAAHLGVRALRYGIPWYKVEPAPGKFDWDWIDQVLEYIAGKGIAVIADLMHYGTPLWLDNQFINHSYPERVAAYAAEFAGRYKHLLSHYTPLNEPMVTMDFCGERGIWPPYLRGSDGSVKLLRALTRGMVLTVEAIREQDPQAVIVNVDAAGESVPADPSMAELAAMRTARTFITTDLITGRVDERHLLWDWLLQHGMSEYELSWYKDRAVDLDIIGVNYYPEASVHLLKQDRNSIIGERLWVGAEGMERSVRAFATRYNKPVMITETSTNGTIAGRMQWLRDSTTRIGKLRAEGIPLVGYTWFPMFDLIDWSYRAGARPIEEFIARVGPPLLDMQQVSTMVKAMGWNRLDQLPLEAYLAPMGLYSLRMQFDGTFARDHTPLVDEYRAIVAHGPELVGNIGRVPLTPQGTAAT